MGKSRKAGLRRSCLAFLAVLTLLAAALPARALNFEDGVRGSKTVTALGGGKRSFRLDYRVWSDDWVNQAAEPCDVILLLDESSAMESPQASGTGENPMEQVKAGVKAFLEGLAEISPDSRVGLVLFGKDISRIEMTALDRTGTEKLLSALSDRKAEGEPDYAGALERAEKLAETLEDADKRPLYLVTVAAGTWKQETREALPALQKLRDQGAKSYTVLLCGSPEEETEEFWQAMSSAPLPSYHYLCGGEAEGCLDRIQRDIASVFSVEVTQRLDPRFELEAAERERLRGEGAHLEQEQDGSWKISWVADLPRRKDSPWTAGLTVQAKKEFPGGNDIPTDGEGTGLYYAGKEIAPLPGTLVNVPLSLVVEDLETEQFLGERVRIAGKGKNVEEMMITTPSPVWFGKGQTGSFSYLWETESGEPIGSLKQLELLRPEKDAVYRLRVRYRPDSRGLSAAGTPVADTEKTALYKIKVVSGTLRIRGTAGSGVTLQQSSSLMFRLERENGVPVFLTAVPEADPESGRIFLEAEAAGLPYGVYTVTPVFGTGLFCEEESRVCRLGVWEKDDTVSPKRNSAQVNYTLSDKLDFVNSPE